MFPLLCIGGIGKCDDHLPISDSFETGKSAPNGWQQGNAAPGVEYVYAQDEASDGKRSLSLQKSAGGFFPMAEWTRTFAHTPSEKSLAFNVKVKAENTSKAIVDLQFFNPNGNRMAHEWLAYIGQKETKDKPANHDWKTYSGKCKVPNGCTKIAIVFQIYGPGKVWFDELNLSYSNLNTKDATNRSPSEPNNSGVADAPPAPVIFELPSGAKTRYIPIPPSANQAKPAAGYPLLFVLPGGNGSEEFHPFVRTIHSDHLDGRFFVAQLIAPPQSVWPTEGSRSQIATTDDSIRFIVEQIRKQHPIDPTRVFALAWSSSGPAIYESILKDNSPLTGAYIAMAVFRPKDFSTFKSIAGKRLFLLHSPEDKVCPYSMAKEAQTTLSAAGGDLRMLDYAGGHGWQGDVKTNIRTGMDWLMRP
jgi:predicted esterase